MFNINWRKLYTENTPNEWREIRSSTWFYLVYLPFRLMYATFLKFKTETDYLNNYNSQIIYLEKRLNDRWDPFNKLIYIDNIADLSRNYLFNKIEARPTTYFYNKWNAAYAYQVGDLVVYKLKVYECLVPNIFAQPDNATIFWKYVKDAPILRNKTEYQLQNNFIVYVPSAVIFDENEMRATINLYKYAGLNYIIIIY